MVSMNSRFHLPLVKLGTLLLGLTAPECSARLLLRPSAASPATPARVVEEKSAEAAWQDFRPYWEACGARAATHALQQSVTQGRLVEDLVSKVRDYLPRPAAQTRFVRAHSSVRTFLLRLAAAERATTEEEELAAKKITAAVAPEAVAAEEGRGARAASQEKKRSCLAKYLLVGHEMFTLALRASGETGYLDVLDNAQLAEMAKAYREKTPHRFLQTLGLFAATTQFVRGLVLLLLQQRGEEPESGLNVAHNLLLHHREQIEGIGKSVGCSFALQFTEHLEPIRSAAVTHASAARLFEAIDAAGEERRKLEAAIVARVSSYAEKSASLADFLKRELGVAEPFSVLASAHVDYADTREALTPGRSPWGNLDADTVGMYIRWTLPEISPSDPKLASKELHWTEEAIPRELGLLEGEVEWRHSRILQLFLSGFDEAEPCPGAEPADLDASVERDYLSFAHMRPGAVSLTARISNGNVELGWTKKYYQGVRGNNRGVTREIGDVLPS
jgi:hypothetical protein